MILNGKAGSVNKYIIEGRTPVPADLMTWAKWFETSDRHVAIEETDGYCVSTVFLGLDHQFSDGPPLLFETMVFGSEGAGNDLWCERTSTWEEAEQAHARGVEFARTKLPESLA